MLNNFSKIVKKLSSPSFNKRIQGFEELRNVQTNEVDLSHLKYLIISSAVVYKDNEDVTKDASNEIIEFVSQYESPHLVDAYVEAFPNMSDFAKSTTLSTLTRFSTQDSLEAFIFLLENHYKNLLYDFPILCNVENKDQTKTLLPKILNFVSNSNISFSIYRYLLECLQFNTIDVNEVEFILPSIFNDFKLLETELNNFSVENRDDIIYPLGLYLDLFSFFPTKEVQIILKKSLDFNDTRLKFFTISSLLYQNENIEPKYIYEVASCPVMRTSLYNRLEEQGLLDLFPKDFLNQKSFSESNMVGWLLYPTELGHVPDEIEFIKSIIKQDDDLGEIIFHAYRFRSSDKNWEKLGWMIGVSGCYVKNEISPYPIKSYTFSNFAPFKENSVEKDVNEIIVQIDSYWKKSFNDDEDELF